MGFPGSVGKAVNAILDEIAAALYPALGQDFTPSPTARRAQARLGVRARNAARRERLELRGFGAFDRNDLVDSARAKSKNWGQRQRPGDPPSGIQDGQGDESSP